MAELLIRGLEQSELDELNRLAHQANSNRTQYVLDILRSHVNGNRPAVIGWIRRDRPGELDEREEPDDPMERCCECGEAIDPNNAYMAVVAGQLRGPYCSECATSK